MSAERGRGLGKGLGALLGEAALQTPQDSDALLLPLTQIDPGPNQPRRQFDADALSALSASIRRYGVLQPITVRLLPSGRYQIIAGERRWRAAQLAGMMELPARVIEADDRKVMEIGLIENLQREDLNPIEEAAGYRALLEQYGLTQEEVSDRVGKSRPSVTNAMRLLALPQEVQTLLKDGTISAGHGRALLALPTMDLQLTLAEQIIQKGLSVRATETQVKQLLTNQPTLNSVTTPPYIREAEQTLSQHFGRKVKISFGKRKGKIELEYKNQADLDAILQLLEENGKEHTHV